MPDPTIYLNDYPNSEPTPDGSVDNTAAFIQAVADAKYGRLVIPPAGNNIYTVKNGPIVCSNPSLVVDGLSKNAQISTFGVDKPIFMFNSPEGQMRNLTLLGKGSNNDAGTFGAYQPTMIIGPSAVGCLVENIDAFGGFYNFWNQCGEANFKLLKGGGAYGTAQMYSTGGGWYRRCQFDSQGLGGSTITSVPLRAWTANTEFAEGSIVWLPNTTGPGAYLIVALSGGVSGVSAPTLRNGGISMPDSTMTWTLLGYGTSYGVQVDTGAVENYFNDVDMSGATAFMAGFGMTNTIPNAQGVIDPTRAPRSVRFTGTCIAAGLYYGAHLADGLDAGFQGGAWGVGLLPSAQGGGAIDADTNWQGDLNIDNVDCIGPYGVVVRGANVNVTNCRVTNCGVDALTVQPGTTNLIASGNNMVGAGRWAANIGGGGSDNLKIFDNNFGTSPIQNNSTGAHNSIQTS